MVATQHACHFFKASELPEGVVLHTDADEWSSWRAVGDAVLHIELRRWADAMVVAPLDANTLGKLANGLCDNLLTCVLRAWDPSRRVLLCPAMNTAMWTHPFTAAHLASIERILPYVSVLPPVAKALACGDVGVGGLAAPADIVATLLPLLS